MSFFSSSSSNFDSGSGDYDLGNLGDLGGLGVICWDLGDLRRGVTGECVEVRRGPP